MIYFVFEEKVAEVIFKEDLFKIFLLFIPYLSEPRVLLFLFSICSNLTEYDTSMRKKKGSKLIYYSSLDCQQLLASHLLAEIGNHMTESDIYENRTAILPYLLEACEEG